MFLLALFGLEVAFRKKKTRRMEAILIKDERYMVPDDLATAFSNQEIRIFRRVFSYFDKDLYGTADVAGFQLFQGNSLLSFSDYFYTIHRARLENRQPEVLEFIYTSEANATGQQGETLFFSLLLFSFIILIGTSSTIFEYFQCESFEEVEPAVKYLVRDYSLNCASKRYKSYVAYAVVMLFIYPLG